MSHRLQITLEDDQYNALAAESAQSGVSMAELVRQSVEARLGLESGDQRADRFRRALGAAVGVWRDRPDDGLAYQRRVRAPLNERATWGSSAATSSRQQTR
jgi:Ribbon-helix-helix protein, copG family